MRFYRYLKSKMITVNNTDERYITLIKVNEDKIYLKFTKNGKNWKLNIFDEYNNQFKLNKINSYFFDHFILSINTFLLSYKPKSLDIIFDMNQKIDFDKLLDSIKLKIFKKYKWAASVTNTDLKIFTFNSETKN